MKLWLALFTAFVFAIQPCVLMAEDPAIAGPDTRIYLADGTVVQGNLVEKTDELVIVRVDHQIFTFDLGEVDNIVTIDSLGGAARTVTVTEFPYISFLGGAVAFSLLSWLQFDRASDKEQEADLNLEHGQLGRSEKLNDQADRARQYGWGSAAVAAGSLGIALFPRKTTRRVFPELTFTNGTPTLRLAYVYRF